MEHSRHIVNRIGAPDPGGREQTALEGSGICHYNGGRFILAFRVTFFKKINILWRTFFVQSFWNFHNMQAIGLLFVLNAVKNDLRKKAEAREAFQRRHLSFYNGHPYLIGIPTGVIIKSESENSNDSENSNAIIRFREIISSPLGAIGDVIFWSHLRPIVLLIPLYFYLLNMPVFSVWITLFITIVIYNIISIKTRWWAINEGLSLGFGVCKDFNMKHFEFEITTLQKLFIITILLLTGALIAAGFNHTFSFGLTLLLNMVIIFWLKTYIIKNPFLLILAGLLLLLLLGRFITA